MKQTKYTIDDAMTIIETWLITGKLESNILADDFSFTSPFWKRANKTEFLAEFLDPTEYQRVVLSKITHFDPVIQLKDKDNKNFAIILQYYTHNGHSVYETVLGNFANGHIIELRSIYDLEETKKALELNL